jgi:hypothetical protein
MAEDRKLFFGVYYHFELEEIGSFRIKNWRVKWMKH